MKKLFAGSLIALGVASANVSAAPTVQVKGLAGGTTLYFSNFLLGALDSAGVSVDDVHPAKLNPSKPRIRFPIGGGVLDLDGALGEIDHAGGLRLQNQEGKSVTLHNFTIEAQAGDVFVSGVVEIDGDIVGRERLFVIDHDEDDVDVDEDGKIRLRKLSLLVTAETVAVLEMLGVTLTENNKAGTASSLSTAGVRGISWLMKYPPP